MYSGIPRPRAFVQSLRPYSQRSSVWTFELVFNDGRKLTVTGTRALADVPVGRMSPIGWRNYRPLTLCAHFKSVGVQRTYCAFTRGRDINHIIVTRKS